MSIMIPAADLTDLLERLRQRPNEISTARKVNEVITKICESASDRNALSDVHWFISELRTTLDTSRIYPVHADYLKLCLAFGLIDEGNMISRNLYTSLSPLLTPLSFLSFNYYAGLVSLRLRDYTHAQTCFLICLSVPGESPSIVQIHAMRKLAFIQLIVDGEISDLPEYVISQSIRREWRGMREVPTDNETWMDIESISPEKIPHKLRQRLSDYEQFTRHMKMQNREKREGGGTLTPSDLADIVKAFKESPDKVKDAVKAIKEDLTKENELNLAEKLVHAKRRHMLLDLGKIYQAVPVEIALRTILASRTDVLIDLIEFMAAFKTSVTARIDGGFVVFEPTVPDEIRSEDRIEQLQAMVGAVHAP
jgi:hypothetical protein